MTKTTKFKPGKSGNPKGRPKGSKDKRTELREMMQPHAEALVNKAVELAKNGDISALRICLDRLIPPYRAKDPVVVVGSMTGTLTEQGQQVIEAVSGGELSPSDGASLLQALASQARIVEIDELTKRIKHLEEKHVHYPTSQ